MTPQLFTRTLLAALAAAAGGAQATTQLDLYSYNPPASLNMAMQGLSSGGAYGVSNNDTNDVMLNTATGRFTVIAGGTGQASGISANGRLVSGNSVAGIGSCSVDGVTSNACGLRQASIYNTSTGNWTPLGSLGYQAGYALDGTHDDVQSTALGISSNGKTVVGWSYFKSTPGSSAVLHPTVFRNGQVYDLNASGAGQNGRALASSGDGSVVVGYKSNSAVGSVWTWNGSGYVESTAPTIAHPVTGVQTPIQVSTVSDNGVWAAGGSVNALAINYGPGGIFAPYTVTFSQATLWNTQTNSALLIPFDHLIDTTNSFSNPDIVRNAKSTVTGVSDAGVAIGTFNLVFTGANADFSTFDTWIYNAHGDGTTQTFDSYLTELGVGLTATQHVSQLYSMAADGSSISGTIYDSSINQTLAFVVHPLTAVPEPGTLLMFGAALPLLAWRRRAAAARKEAA
ncbi:PEP-CTERM sorting domain-containing protein [Paucibacter sp. R3-3]|uniref:PEP-CTERM sorting domain-containing protein n=1 Tax=Roseateles agri TaxID=3098619 RepID=A0ABU5DED7_9BURK|nr:PEP-CTERM sorting domain-containing protein [Paucibacter sp. R3-3]MDY0744641.1 PEP-CTERM sorting domain-containing protein [Paucibacter sp. R3-3]